MNLEQILGEYSPLTLTEAVRMIKEEPFVLTRALGRNVIRSATDTCAFEVEEGTYHLAPMGYSGDPATNVNVGRKRVTHTVTPPQLFMKDRVTASELNSVRALGANPINMTANDKGAAFDELIGIKQQGLRRMIDRRLEWMFAQAMNGKIEYQSESGRAFSFDYGLPPAVNMSGGGSGYWNADGDPLHQLRALSKEFRRLNAQIAPDLIVMGGDAGDAFMNNAKIEAWLKSPGVNFLQTNAPLGRGEAQPLGTLQGAEIYEYCATYEEADGRGKVKAVPYLEPDYVYLTNSRLWRLHYGAIHDFDAGDPPVVMGELFSNMKIASDGKSMDIFVESHPLPVMVSDLAVVRAKVVG
ncbi:MAG: major capsid protein [Synergistaceae bacterium]|nr:major capsid protein [Synergistaceae bacterium]